MREQRRESPARVSDRVKSKQPAPQVTALEAADLDTVLDAPGTFTV